MRKSKSKGGAILAVAVVAAIGGISGYQVYSRVQHTEALREKTLEGAIPKISVVNPQAGPSEENLTLPGSVDAWYQAPIYAQVSGYVKMWHKDFGAHVKTGDLLAEINTPALDAEYAQAKADLRSAEAKYNLAVVTAKRWVALRNSQAVSEQSITEQEANAQSEKALYEAAQQNVKRFEALQKFKQIVAPFDGTVTSRSINVGDLVNEGGGSLGASGDATELFSVADTHSMRLFVSVPAVFSYMLKPGLTADVEVTQYPNRHYTANFLTVAKGYDPNTRTAVTEFTLDNGDASLWPGSYATVKLTAPADNRILTIPTSALVFEENGLQVATVTADQRIHYKPVTAGKILGEQVQITDGLTAGDRIADNPPAALMEGEEVELVPPTPGYSHVAPAAEAAGSKAPHRQTPETNLHSSAGEVKR
ncbi:efflux RND transporter periplasmic adaptor subunit [Azotobacter beijerinckii]|uniref:efflux RND transporter periplasmic adaptor subunit n=1 Tax=Azotobacter beijerinckii TaxID=170623 RepID=UPI00295559D9|nr:efflux RND transporter periplasmic adaptor subunit [Azotobacter beijerinckii]MDV7211983.1 efflux RND transporter periplasmic adaptor subunit [Azotobacter beijerinckii]